MACWWSLVSLFQALGSLPSEATAGCGTCMLQAPHNLSDCNVCDEVAGKAAVLLQVARLSQNTGYATVAFGREHLMPFHSGMMHQSQVSAAAELLNDTSLLEFKQAQPLEQPGRDAKQISMPWETDGARPLVSCQTLNSDLSNSEANGNLREAISIYCNAKLGELVEFYVDPQFQATYDRLRDSDGWIDRAFVTYMGLKEPHDKIGAEEDLLVQSVHHFSQKPVLVTNFGSWLPSTWTPERFPNMVIMHARSAKKLTGKSFNFNKMSAMLFTKVKTGIVLDADQWVNHGLDYLFDRVEQETTAAYPYPILPVHWMSRDPESDDMGGYPPHYSFNFQSAEAPARTMRWGHAHPTWTYYALPFVARWTSYVLAPEKTQSPKWLQEQGWVEDEDMLNMASWAEGATKQWCKFDMPSPTTFEMYLNQPEHTEVLSVDRKWYPRGIAYVFFTAHDAKDPQVSFGFLSRLWDDGDDNRKAILYDGKWFGSAKVLKKFDPELNCIA